MEWSGMIEELRDSTGSYRYNLDKLIGHGTYGNVYIGVNSITGERVALKVVDCVSDEKRREVLAECLVLRRFCSPIHPKDDNPSDSALSQQHPCLPLFFGAFLERFSSDRGVATERVLIAMELCERGSVADLSRGLLEIRRRLSEAHISYIMQRLLSALEFLHDRLVIHRDVKGRNVLLNHAGEVKLVDFGVATVLSQAGERAHSAMGTPYWMAPEVAACQTHGGRAAHLISNGGLVDSLSSCDEVGTGYDARCDIWSLGITAIELLEGEAPYADLPPMRALLKIQRSPPPTIRNAALVMESLKEFITRCLTRNFGTRPNASKLLESDFITKHLQEADNIRASLCQLSDELAKQRPPEAGGARSPQGAAPAPGPMPFYRAHRHFNPRLAHDLSRLSFLDQDTIVHCLRDRYLAGLIYTSVGDVLLALNPFASSGGARKEDGHQEGAVDSDPFGIYLNVSEAELLNAGGEKKEEGDPRYGRAVAALYSQRANGALLIERTTPHIFGTGLDAFLKMLHSKKDQVIVLSGESGAGKTESSKYLLQHFSHLGHDTSQAKRTQVQAQITELLEAFGNAQTTVHANSSRFAKYHEIIFDEKAGKILGSRLSQFLLEKMRVVKQARGERNFHVLYDVRDSLSSFASVFPGFIIHNQVPFRYLGESNKETEILPYTTSAERTSRYSWIQGCARLIGFTEQELFGITSVLVSVLHMGNVEFGPEPGSATDPGTTMLASACTVINRNLLQTVASLLGLSAKELALVLTGTQIIACGETIVREHEITEAESVRDTIAKELYSRLFAWLVRRINQLHFFDDPEKKNRIIGILDIFGFEIIEHNSFEQLCINLTNEQLQYYFNQHVFSLELDELALEGIELHEEIQFPDNRPTLDLLLARPLGVLALLDEESHFPRATDRTFLAKIAAHLKSDFLVAPRSSREAEFGVVHYAGLVRYQVDGFLEKNRDWMPPEVAALMRTSELALVRALFNQFEPTESYGGTLCAGDQSLALPSIALSSTFASVSNAFSTTASNVTQLTQISAPPGATHFTKSTKSAVSKRRQTVVSYFRGSLLDLIGRLSACTPHFVRCIRPNAANVPREFESVRVLLQLRYSGVLEAVKIRRQGFSYRPTIEEFLERHKTPQTYLIRYGDFAAELNDELISPGARCAAILEKIGLKNYRIGRTRLFLKHHEYEELMRQRELLVAHATRIQALVRGVLERQKVGSLRKRRAKAAIILQKHIRGFVARRKFTQDKKDISTHLIRVQSARGYLARKRCRPKFEQTNLTRKRERSEEARLKLNSSERPQNRTNLESNRAVSLEERIERDDRLRVSSIRLERSGVSGRESALELEARWRKSAWNGAESALAYYMKVW